MQVVFVNPPSLRRDTHDLAPPLWALILGAIVQRSNHTPLVLDLNLEVLSGKTPDDPESFIEWSVRLILSHNPRVICYSSMGLNSHVALAIAETIREKNKEVIQIVGGPHFSAIASETLKHFLFIDAVFLGEAERSLPLFLAAIKLQSSLDTMLDTISIPGVATRASVTAALQSPSASRLPVSPADVPVPAYELVELDRYFSLNPRRLLDFEAARRGCIYACRFCYAPNHFGRGERTPSDERFINEMRVVSQLGARHLFIVTDNFVNHPTQTARLCDAIATAALPLTFNCYATLAQLTEAVIPSLVRAQCRAVYVGVDAVHPQARKEFAKGMFRSDHDLFRRIDRCLSHYIIPTLAFLLEEPEKSRERFEATVATAAAVASRGCPIALNTLTIYPGTPLACDATWSFTPSDLKARIAFDAPEIVCSNSYAQQLPHLFPFHATHRSLEQHGRLLLLAHTLKTLLSCAPREVARIAERGKSLPLLTELLSDISPEDFAKWDPSRRRSEPVKHFLAMGSARTQKLA